MATPDDGMDVHPTGVTNARTLQSGSPDLYALVSDTTSEGHAWLPSVMPDGKYKGLISNDNPLDDNDNDEKPVPTCSFGKKKCNKTEGCSYHRKKKTCLPAKSTQECTKYVGKKKSCLKKGCLWKVPGKAKCSGRWD